MNTLVNFQSAQPSKTGQFSIGVNMPDGFPVGLSEQFGADNQKIIQWNAFVNRNNLRAESLGNTVRNLRDALAFIFQGMNA